MTEFSAETWPAVFAADTRRIKAMVEADIDALQEIIADDCTYVHSTGVIDSKQSYLQTLAEGNFRYAWIKAEDATAVDLGGAVLVLHRMVAEFVVDGVPRDYRGQAAAVWRLGPDTPRLAYFQSTNLPAT